VPVIRYEGRTQAVTQILAVLLGAQVDDTTEFSEFKIYDY